MYTDDSSWFVTTEVTLLPSSGEDRSVRVQVISLPDGVTLDENGRHPYIDTMNTVGFADLEEPLRHRARGWLSPYSAEDAAVIFVAGALDDQKGVDLTLLARDLLSLVPVPVFGSPPSDWDSLGNLLTTTGGAGAAAALAVVDGDNVPVTLIVSFTAMTVVMNVVSPATRALGRGIAYRIDQFMGTPPEQQAAPPAAPTAEAPTATAATEAPTATAATAGSAGSAATAESADT